LPKYSEALFNVKFNRNSTTQHSTLDMYWFSELCFHSFYRMFTRDWSVLYRFTFTISVLKMCSNVAIMGEVKISRIKAMFELNGGEDIKNQGNVRII